MACSALDLIRLLCLNTTKLRHANESNQNRSRILQCCCISFLTRPYLSLSLYLYVSHFLFVYFSVCPLFIIFFFVAAALNILSRSHTVLPSSFSPRRLSSLFPALFLSRYRRNSRLLLICCLFIILQIRVCLCCKRNS